MKKVLIMLLLSFCCSCSETSETERKLENNFAVTNNFNKKEVFSLKLILDFFDEFVLRKTNLKDTSQAYHYYIESIRNAETYEEIIKKIGLTPVDTRLLVEQLKNNNVFNEIWIYEYGRSPKTNDTLSISLAPNIQGKYLMLLIDLANENDNLKEYVEMMNECACIPSVVVAGFQKAHKEFDFNNDMDRLFWAVHYITIVSEEEW